MFIIDTKEWIADKVNDSVMSYNRFVERPEFWHYEDNNERIERFVIRQIKRETDKAILAEVSTLKQFGRYVNDCLRTNKGFDFWIPKSEIIKIKEVG